MRIPPLIQASGLGPPPTTGRTTDAAPAELPEAYRASTIEIEDVFAGKRLDLVELARRCWDARSEFRRLRARVRDYVRGRQWETTKDKHGRTVSEAERMEEQGRIAWVMNEILPIVTNLLGQYRQSYTDSTVISRDRKDAVIDEMLTATLESVNDLNETSELDVLQLLEALIGGTFGWKVRAEWHDEEERDEVRIDPIDQTRFFFSPDLADPRTRDVDVLGELHDWTLDEIVQNFASTPDEEAGLRRLFADLSSDEDLYHRSTFGTFDHDYLNFYYPVDPSKGRILEVWRKEYEWVTYAHDHLDGTYMATDLTPDQVAQINRERAMEAELMGLAPELIELDQEYVGRFVGYWLTADGTVLQKAVNPYWHNSHPFVFGFTMLLDGEYMGKLANILDPQRLINRMTASVDFLFGIGAKGLLMVPEDTIPEDMNLDDFADAWSTMGGVVKIKLKPGAKLPQQITANAIPAGAFQWIGAQRDWLEKISGVTASVQGIAQSGDTPAARFNQEVQQGQLSNLNIFESLRRTRRRRDYKALGCALQFYEKRVVGIPGKRDELIEFSPEMVRSVNYTVAIQDVQDTATSDQLWEDKMNEWLIGQRITFGQYLANSAHPKAPVMLAYLQQNAPWMVEQPLSPELFEAAAAGDPDAVALVQQMQDPALTQQAAM
jgi:hypothetical protein